MTRGRPANTMTHRRQQVLSEIADAVAQGESVTRSALARRCGLYSYREASRIMRDLKKMGALI